MAESIGTAPGGWQQSRDGTWQQTGAPTATLDGSKGSIAAVPGATWGQNNITGQFVPIDSALGQAQKTPGFSADQFINETLGKGFSSSALQGQASTFQAQIRAEEEARKREQEGIIKGAYSARRGEVSGEFAAREGGINALGGQAKGGGGLSGLGFSGVQESQIQLSRQTRDKALNELTRLESDALSKNSLESADRIQDRLDKAIKADLDEQELLWKRQKDMITLALDFSKENRALNDQEFARLKFSADQMGKEQKRIEDHLTRIGYSMDPDTGEIFQTLAAASQERDDFRADLALTLQEKHREFSRSIEEARLAISQQQLQLSQGREARLLRGEKEEKSFSFSVDEKGQLLNVGMDNEDVNTLQEAINSVGKDRAFAVLNDEQRAMAESILSGEESSTEFLSKDYIRNLYSPDALEAAAAEAGFGDLGEGVFNLKDVDTEAYLDYIEKLINQYRESGMSDKEILEQMT